MPPDQASEYPKPHSHECPTCGATGEVVTRDAEGLHYTDCDSCFGAGTLPYRAKPVGRRADGSPSFERLAPPPHEHGQADAAAEEAGSKG